MSDDRRPPEDDEAYWTATAHGAAAWTADGKPLTLPDPRVPGSEVQALYERWCQDFDPDAFPTEPVGQRVTPGWFVEMTKGAT